MIVILLIILWSLRAAQVPPTWLPSPYIQTDNYNIINSFTGQGVKPNVTMLFKKAFTQIPHLGYGIFSYKGHDALGSEIFIIQREQLTQSYFSVSVQIKGSTFLYLLNVRYIAIDLQFPHLVNSLDNVPSNYGSGTKSGALCCTHQNILKTYRNTINYTEQSLNSIYNRFTTPLQSNKVLIMLTVFEHQGSNDLDWNNPARHNDRTRWVPLDIRVDAWVVSEEEYLLEVKMGYRNRIKKIHFSILFFNVEDVKLSESYLIEYHRFDLTKDGGFLPMPFEFIDNFIIGWTNFSSERTSAAIVFQWNFVTKDGLTGLQMPISVAPFKNYTPITKYGFSFFYLKTYKCPQQTVFNSSSNLCSFCPLQGCLKCYNLTMCKQCNQKQNFFLDIRNGQCIDCSQQLCSVQQVKIERTGCNEFTVSFNFLNTSKEFIEDNFKIMTQGIHIQQIFNEGNKMFVKCTHERSLASTPIVLEINSIRYTLSDNKNFPSLFHFSESECATNAQISNLMDVTEILSYLIMVISLISCKIVGLELFGVLQLSYFSLMNHDFLVLYLSPLSNFRSLNGYNPHFFIQDHQIPWNIGYIDLKILFLNNINVMIILLMCVLSLGSILFIMGKLLKTNKTLSTISLRVLKQIGITLFIFNAYNSAFSMGIQLRHAKTQTKGIHTFSGIVMWVYFVCVLVAVVFLETCSQEHYGEFKEKFKNNFVCKVYIALTIVYRYFIGIYFSINSDAVDTLVGICVVMSFTLYAIVNLPFKSLYQNYRCILIRVSQLTIFLVLNFYRSMKKNERIDIKAHIHIPALIELVVIVVCLSFSILALVYQIYSDIKKWRERKQNNARIKNTTFEQNCNYPREQSFQSLVFN